LRLIHQDADPAPLGAGRRLPGGDHHPGSKPTSDA
jgi:hypothetical protein